MIKEKMKAEEALEKGRMLPYVMIRALSEVYIGYQKEGEIDLSQLEEARFFDDITEIRLIRYENNWLATYIRLEEQDKVLKHVYKIANARFGKRLETAWILASDEDGQTYIAEEKLSGWGE